MPFELSGPSTVLASWESVVQTLASALTLLNVLIGFSIIIFVHELGHFLAAKWMGVRVDRFAIGFFYRLVGYRRGEGVTFGPRPAANYTPEKLAAHRLGETDYCLNALPFGGYVRMLGEDDLQFDEKTGELIPSADPRAFTNKPVWKRMVVVSGGVVFNVLFALLVFMVVFLWIGKPMIAPTVGVMTVDSPFLEAGLRPGDRIVEADGGKVQSFEDIVIAYMLSDDSIRVRVERDGRVLEGERTITTRRDGVRAAPGVDRPLTMRLRAPRRGLLELPIPGLEPGDVITHVNGAPAKTYVDIVTGHFQSTGDHATYTVERRTAGGVRAVDVAAPLELLLAGAADGETPDNILGLAPRAVVRQVFADLPAAKGGLLPGDVIVRWGSVATPTYPEILDGIAAAKGPIDVVVERGGEQRKLSVEPRSGSTMFGASRPRIGAGFGPEAQRPIVAAVVDGSDAALAGVPRGAQIVAVGGQTVSSWIDVARALRAAAGASIDVRYRVGADEASTSLVVPSSIVNEIGLPPGAAIRSIDGQSTATLASGRKVSLPSAEAARALFSERIGKRAEVVYSDSIYDPGLQTVAFNVRAGNADPWQLGVLFVPRPVPLEDEKVLVHAHGNPLRAAWMGVEFTWRGLMHVYRSIEAMMTQKVSVDNVSGPIGIFTVGYEQAAAGWGDLLYFLAVLSLNLAVLNFLPLPVVDGGLMVFLILEKLRGKPVSVKIQIATTLTGLALIVLTFVFVTVQDISRLIGA